MLVDPTDGICIVAQPTVLGRHEEMIQAREDENLTSLISRSNCGVVQELRVLRGYLLIHRSLEYPHWTLHFADKSCGIQLKMVSEPLPPRLRYAALDRLMNVLCIPSCPRSEGIERTSPCGDLC